MKEFFRLNATHVGSVVIFNCSTMATMGNQLILYLLLLVNRGKLSYLGLPYRQGRPVRKVPCSTPVCPS